MFLLNMYQRQLKYLDLILKNNKVPHAFLFYGRDAVYLKETAKDFLARLNEAEYTPAIKAEVHPDTLFVKRQADKKDIAIAQVRSVKDFSARTPLILKKKGVFIEEAQYLNEESWNALLKTLEEPSASTLIFLISGDLNSIPKTITSRVLTLPFQASADNLAKPAFGNDDIILSKLAGLEKLALAERFDLAKELAEAENKLEILDAWLIRWRSKLISAKDKATALKIENVAKTKNILATTNANPRLVLENLFLDL